MSLTPYTLIFRALAFAFCLAMGLSVVMSMGQQAQATVQCEGVFDSSNKPTLENQAQIKKAILDLANLRMNIDRTRTVGSKSPVLAALTASFIKKEKELAVYLEKYQIMTAKELSERVRQEILEIQKKKPLESEAQRQARKAAEFRFILDFLQKNEASVLNRVEPGTFRMGERKNFFNQGTKVTIERPFELMSTPTTVGLWKAVTFLANLRYPGKYKFAGPYPSLHDHLPVTWASYDQAQVWLDALNEMSQNRDSVLEYFIAGHKDGDFYRLPKDAEWEFVLRDRGRATGKYHFGEDSSQLPKYAWVKESGVRSVQLVAQKLPLVVDGKEFYDMYGNVDEWVQDWYKAPESRVLRAGDYNTPSSSINSYNRRGMNPSDDSGQTGFRFVREVLP